MKLLHIIICIQCDRKKCFFFITYLTETYGKDTVKEFFDVLNTKHGPRDCYYPDFICENLKEFYGEELFTEFGKWFLQNKSKYCG